MQVSCKICEGFREKPASIKLLNNKRKNGENENNARCACFFSPWMSRIHFVRYRTPSTAIIPPRRATPKKSCTSCIPCTDGDWGSREPSASINHSPEPGRPQQV